MQNIEYIEEVVEFRFTYETILNNIALRIQNSGIKEPKVLVIGNEEYLIPILKLTFPKASILSFVMGSFLGFKYDKIDSFREVDFTISFLYDNILDLELIGKNTKYAHIHIKEPDINYSIVRDFYDWSVMERTSNGYITIIKFIRNAH
jgi:hypothetical protein